MGDKMKIYDESGLIAGALSIHTVNPYDMNDTDPTKPPRMDRIKQCVSEAGNRPLIYDFEQGITDEQKAAIYAEVISMTRGVSQSVRFGFYDGFIPNAEGLPVPDNYFDKLQTFVHAARNVNFLAFSLYGMNQNPSRWLYTVRFKVQVFTQLMMRSRTHATLLPYVMPYKSNSLDSTMTGYEMVAAIQTARLISDSVVVWGGRQAGEWSEAAAGIINPQL